jgi:AcrR family transcriptional regulator
LEGNLRAVFRISAQTRKKGRIIDTSTKKRTRLAPQDRRDQLVRIGARLFAERPFSDVWIEEVAEQAGVSRGLVYHYFPNKRDFYAAIVRHGSADALRLTAPDNSLPPMQRLRASLDHFLEYVESNESAVRSIYRGQHSVDEEVRAVIREGRDAQAHRILQYLEPDSAPSATLMLALEGWMNFNDSLILDWLETHAISRDKLLDLMTGALAGILVAAYRVDEDPSGSTVLGQLEAELAASA